jgi:outer membrane immunogenic protein
VTLSQTRWLSGWTGGAGIEYAFAPNWSAKVEYLRYGFGAQTFQALGGGAALLVTLPTFNIDTAKVGINYRF